MSSFPPDATVKLGDYVNFICTYPADFVWQEIPQVCLVNDATFCIKKGKAQRRTDSIVDISFNFSPNVEHHGLEFACSQATGTVKISVLCMLR